MRASPLRKRAITQTHTDVHGTLLTRATWRVQALDNPGVGSGLLRGNVAEGGDGNEWSAGRV